MSPPQLTIERLKQVLSYDAETGNFIWIVSPARRVTIGDIAGTNTCGGLYIGIHIDSRLYYGHRLAWFYSYGSWPSSEIDHKDRNGLNNKLDNLRLATSSQNKVNLKRKSLSGFTGVSWLPQGHKHWRASIKANGRFHHLGMFHTAEAAHAAYLSEAKRLYGDFVPSK